MRKRHGPRDIGLEYTFDRLFPAKLQQVYELLVPDRVRSTRDALTPEGERHEERRDLRSSVLRPTEGGAHDCESNRSADHLCAGARLSRAARMGFRRRRV